MYAANTASGASKTVPLDSSSSRQNRVAATRTVAAVPGISTPNTAIWVTSDKRLLGAHALDSDHQVDLVAHGTDHVRHSVVGALHRDFAVEAREEFGLVHHVVAGADMLEGCRDALGYSMKGQVAGDFVLFVADSFHRFAGKCDFGELFGVEKVGALEVDIAIFAGCKDTVSVDLDFDRALGWIGIKGEATADLVEPTERIRDIHVLDAKNHHGVGAINCVFPCSGRQRGLSRRGLVRGFGRGLGLLSLFERFAGVGFVGLGAIVGFVAAGNRKDGRGQPVCQPGSPRM